MLGTYGKVTQVVVASGVMHLAATVAVLPAARNASMECHYHTLIKQKIGNTRVDENIDTNRRNYGCANVEKPSCLTPPGPLLLLLSTASDTKRLKFKVYGR